MTGVESDSQILAGVLLDVVGEYLPVVSHGVGVIANGKRTVTIRIPEHRAHVCCL